MDFLVDSIKACCLKQGFNKTYWIAYSGGVDSQALLHACMLLRKKYPIQFKAIHIHHGLSSHADDWAKQCEKVCHEWGIAYLQKAIQVDVLLGESPEEVARASRYAAFETILGEEDCLITAHHQDDQAETVLLQLFRGAGPKGLAAMPMAKRLGAGFHLRPLLGITRAELVQYATHYQLDWIEDESNQDVRLTRNFLRHAIFPLLKERWPSIAKTLSRVAVHCAEAETICDITASADLQTVLGASCDRIVLSPFSQLSAIRQRYVLREWFKTLQFPLPSFAKIRQIQQDFLQANPDKSPYMSWKNVEIRRYQGHLYAMKYLKPHSAEKRYEWLLEKPLLLPDQGMLHATLTTGNGLRADIKTLEIRFREGGERCQLLRHGKHHALKKLFQSWGVPPWERSRIPLLYLNDQLVGVLGYFINETYRASPKDQGYLLHFTPT